MAATTGGIDIGDAVLNFLADTTQLDAALDRINAATAAKLQPATDSTVALAAGFEKAGTSAAAATTNIDLNAKALLANGLTAKEATAVLVGWGYSQKEAAAAAGLVTTAIKSETASLEALRVAAIDPGKTLADAFRLLTPVVKQSESELQNMAFALRSVEGQAGAAFGDLGSAAGKATTGLIGTRQELQTINQALGVGLPRGVTAFLSQIPGIGAALDVAFSASVVFFLIEAIVKVGQKIEELAAQTGVINEAWRDFGDVATKVAREVDLGLLEADAALNRFDASAKLAAAEMRNLGKDSTEASRAVKEIGDSLLKALNASAVSKFNPLSWWNANSREDAKDADEFFKLLASDVERLGAGKGLTDIATKLESVNERIADTVALQKQAASGWSDSYFAGIITGLSNQRAALQGLQADLEKIAATRAKSDAEARDVADRTELQSIISIGAAKEAAATKVANAITDVELQQALIRNSRLAISYLEDAKAQADANEQKYQNTVRALEEQKGVEGERFKGGIIDYKQYAAEVVKIDGDITVAEKENLAKQLKNAAEFGEARQRLLLVQHAQIEKSLETPQATYPTDKIDAFSKSTDELARAELRLAQAQTQLALTNITQNYAPQEAAITALANFGIITEQKKAERLRGLYAQEEADKLKALNEESAKEYAAVQHAQAQLDKVLSDPLGHEKELEEAQKYLDQVVAQFDKTQQQLTTTKAAYEAKRLSLERGAVAEAIALAESEGKQELATQIEDSQATLDLARNKLLLAKARGADTSAAEAEVKAAQQATKALVDEASKGKVASQAMVEWSTTGKQALLDFGSAIETATAAVVSGQESMGKAIESSMLGVISKLAQHWADYYFGLAIAAAAGFDWAQAAGYTAAATALEVVAGVTGGLASSTSQTSASTSGIKGPAPNTGTTSAAVSPTQQPVSVVNAPKLAGGGLFSKQTLAVVGDVREAVIPLGQDSNALDEIASRIQERMGGGAGSVVNHNYNIKGDVIDHAQLMRKQTQMAKQGKGRLTVNNSFRLTRRG